MTKLVGREVVGQKHEQTREIPVEGWGGAILIRKLSHLEVVKIQNMARDAVDKVTRQVKDATKVPLFNFELVRLSWIDDKGEFVLTDAKADYEWLVGEPNTTIKTLTDQMAEFSGLNDAAEKDAEKN